MLFILLFWWFKVVTVSWGNTIQVLSQTMLTEQWSYVETEIWSKCRMFFWRLTVSSRKCLHNFFLLQESKMNPANKKKLIKKGELSNPNPESSSKKVKLVPDLLHSLVNSYDQCHARAQTDLVQGYIFPDSLHWNQSGWWDLLLGIRGLLVQRWVRIYGGRALNDV